MGRTGWHRLECLVVTPGECQIGYIELAASRQVKRVSRRQNTVVKSANLPYAAAAAFGELQNNNDPPETSPFKYHPDELVGGGRGGGGSSGMHVTVGLYKLSSMDNSLKAPGFNA
jgi:hypothetical protein